MNSLQDAIRAAGLTPPEEIQPGKIHRFPGQDKGRANRSAWCKLFSDGMGGCFGDYSTGIRGTWQAKREFTSEERATFARKLRSERRQRQRIEAEKRRQARAQLEAQWRAASPETGHHRYLRAKGVGAYGIRTNGESLLIPLRDAQGQLHGLQAITPHGGKKFLKGSDVKGHYHAIGKPRGQLFVCEGYATGASIHEASGQAVAVAFDAGNLKPVAKALRSAYPALPIVIAADNDQWAEGNPGMRAARDAAEAVGGAIVFPEFGREQIAMYEHQHGKGPSDFNDLHQLSGVEAVALFLKREKPSQERAFQTTK